MSRKQLKWGDTQFIGSAKKYAGWDGTTVAVEVSPASQAETVAGTEDFKPITPLALEQKRSIKSNTLANAATGTTNIDCGGKQEHKVVYTVTVTGNITITKTNDASLETLHIVIPITGANVQITFPSDCRMSRYHEVASGDGWLQASKILQVSSQGTADLHEFSLVRAGSIFKLNYDGPARA